MIHLGVSGYSVFVLYFGGIIVFVLSILWRPELGVYFLVPFLPLQNTRYRLHGLLLGEKFVDILLLGVFLGLVFQRRSPLFARTPLNKFLIVFAIYTFISLCHGSFYLGIDLPFSLVDPRFSEWKNYMVMPFLFVLVATVMKDIKQVKILVFLMCVSFLLVNRSFYYQMSGRDFSHFSYELRSAGPLGYAGENGLAAFEVEFSVFLLALGAFQKGTVRKLALLGMVATGVYCLMLSFSRGGYLAFLAGLLFLGVIKDRKLLPLLVIILIAWQTLVPKAVEDRVEMTYDQQSGELDHSAATRVYLWQDAAAVIRESPIFGTGFNTYRYMGRSDYTDTHNYYLKVFLEGGFVALMLYLWLMGKAFKAGYGLFRSSSDPFLSSVGLGFAALIVVALVLNCFGDRWTYLQVSGFLWALMGCVVRGQLLTAEAEAPTVENASIRTEELASPLPA
jgi:putative inorganic carbon (HCO3(-)) transporter